jgi:hypothetical protein
MQRTKYTLLTTFAGQKVDQGIVSDVEVDIDNVGVGTGQDHEENFAVRVEVCGAAVGPVQED